MGEPNAARVNFNGEFTLNNFDLWAERPEPKVWDPSYLMLDSYAMLSQADYGPADSLDGFLLLGSHEVLNYEGFKKNDASRCLPEAYRIARIFKKREWGIVLLTFDGPDSPFERKVDVGPDVKPFLEGDMKEAFTEAVIVYLGPQLEEGPYADYGPVLLPLTYPYTAPENWEPNLWTL